MITKWVEFETETWAEIKPEIDGRSRFFLYSLFGLGPYRCVAYRSYEKDPGKLILKIQTDDGGFSSAWFHFFDLFHQQTEYDWVKEGF